MHFELDIEDSGRFAAILDLVTHIDEFTDNTVREAVVDAVAPAILPEAQIEPGPVAKPIVWTSAKQRRFVMMKIRKGEIPAPYVRTHAVSQGYQLDVTTVPGDYTEIALRNIAPHFRFVEGDNQQQMHINTGWLNAPSKAQAWAETTVNKLRAAFQQRWEALKGGGNGR